MSDELKRLFKAADAVLFNLHRQMEQELRLRPGKENWREVFAMRIKLGQAETMCANNFKVGVCDASVVSQVEKENDNALEEE